MTWTRRKDGLAWLMLIGQIIFFLAAPPLRADEPSATAAPSVAQEEAAAEDLPSEPEGVEGVACYYKKHYHGKRTHSGSAYHHGKLTAAHPTLPHGSRVKVVNLANNRSVIVTINDRCRKRSIEFIDLSRSAASRLGFLGKGTARVRIIPLEHNGVSSGR